MKIKIMTAEAIKYVKENIKQLTSYYETGADPQVWIKEKIGKEAFVEVPELEFEDCQLLISEDAPSANDPENIKLFYLNFKDINDSFASDERLWAGLAHTVYYDYLLKRWPKGFEATNIKNHFFFAGGPRSYMMNTLSRLWWYGKMTYRKEEQEPWKILDYFSHDINGYGFTLFGSNWSNSAHSLDLFFEAIFEYTDENKRKVDRQLFNDARVYTTCLCGIYVLDACEDRFIIDKIKEYLNQRYTEIVSETERNKLNNVRSTGVERFDNIIKAFNVIGGHGTYSELTKAFETVTQKRLSVADKIYIDKQLKTNCPDNSQYNGKPIFYKIIVNNSKQFKLANEYLTKDNVSNRKKIIREQMEKLSNNEQWTLNFITAIRKEKFALDELMQFSVQYKAQHIEVENPEKEMKQAVQSLREKGLLEYVDNGILKKAYNLKEDR